MTTAPNFNVKSEANCVRLDFRTDNFEVDNDLITMWELMNAINSVKSCMVLTHPQNYQNSLKLLWLVYSVFSMVSGPRLYSYNDAKKLLWSPYPNPMKISPTFKDIYQFSLPTAFVKQWSELSLPDLCGTSRNADS